MEPRKIKSLMVLKEISQSEIAKELKITRQSVCQTIAGSSKSPRVRKAIARKLQMPYHILWNEAA